MEEMIESIRKVTFTENDILVLTCERHLTDTQYSRINDAIEKQKLPFNNKVMLLEGGLQLSVLTEKEDCRCQETACFYHNVNYVDHCKLVAGYRDKACAEYHAMKSKEHH